jgi:hypothetical protein
VNFGNPEEVKVLDLARTILTLVGSVGRHLHRAADRRSGDPLP